MSRKMYVNVTTRLIIRADDDADFGDIMADMDYHFTSLHDGADVENSEIRDYEVTDSK